MSKTQEASEQEYANHVGEQYRSPLMHCVQWHAAHCDRHAGLVCPN